MPVTLENARLKILRDYMPQSNVSGVCSGFKLRGERLEPTGDTGIVVFVREKKPLDALTPSERIPATIDGFVTDVIQADFKPHANLSSDLLTPVQPGLSVGPRDDTSVGTLGPLVKDGSDNLYMMTCWHVLASVLGVLSDDVVSPGYGDITEALFRTIGSSGDYIISERGDAVLIPLTVSVVPEIINQHVIPTHPETIAVPGLTMAKWGRSTGLTWGIINSVGTIELDYSEWGGGTIYMYTWQIVSLGVICAEGDSGAVWYDVNSYAGKGLHVAGTEDGLVAAACHMKYLTDDLSVTLVESQGNFGPNRLVGSLNVVKPASAPDIIGSLNVLGVDQSLIPRVTISAGKYYLPRYTYTGGVYVLDEAGAYVEDPSSPGTYILLATHPTGGYYDAVDEILAGSGVHYVKEN